jgi:hypothetical protein
MEDGATTILKDKSRNTGPRLEIWLSGSFHFQSQNKYIKRKERKGPRQSPLKVCSSDKEMWP